MRPRVNMSQVDVWILKNRVDGLLPAMFLQVSWAMELSCPHMKGELPLGWCQPSQLISLLSSSSGQFLVHRIIES